jgi:hypothetical protein
MEGRDGSMEEHGNLVYLAAMPSRHAPAAALMSSDQSQLCKTVTPRSADERRERAGRAGAVLWRSGTRPPRINAVHVTGGKGGKAGAPD